jgi:hypothetical protein
MQGFFNTQLLLKNYDTDVFVNWAKDMASGEPSENAIAIEKLRFDFLKHIKNATASDNNPYYLLLVLIHLDRANALYNMKVNRDDPNCPNGFIWCTEESLKKNKFDEMIVYNGVAQRSSITSHYLKYALLNEMDAVTFSMICELLDTEIPEHMTQLVQKKIAEMHNNIL